MFPGAKGKLLRIEIVPKDTSGELHHIGIGFEVFNEDGVRIQRRGHTIMTRVRGELSYKIADRSRAARIRELSEELLRLSQQEMLDQYLLDAPV